MGRWFVVVGCAAWCACHEYASISPGDAGPDATPPAADAGDAGDGCLHERIDLTRVVLTPDNTFDGDQLGGGGPITVDDAGVTAQVDAGVKGPVLGLVLTARGWVRWLGFAARTAKIRFETRTLAASDHAVAGCWIIHVNPGSILSVDQIGFSYGAYAQDKTGLQFLRARAPANDVGDNVALGGVRAVGGPAQVMTLESTRSGDDVTYVSTIEGDAGASQSYSLTSRGLSSVQTAVVCGTSVYEVNASSRASATWVELDACP